MVRCPDLQIDASLSPPPPHTTDITFQQPNPPPLIKFSMTKTFSKHFDCCMILGHFFEHFSCGCLLLLHPSIAIYADVVLPLPSRAMDGSSAQVAATDPCIYAPTIWCTPHTCNNTWLIACCVRDGATNGNCTPAAPSPHTRFTLGGNLHPPPRFSISRPSF